MKNIFHSLRDYGTIRLELKNSRKSLVLERMDDKEAAKEIINEFENLEIT